MGSFSEQNHEPESPGQLILSFTQKLTRSYLAEKSDVNHNTGLGDFLLSQCEITRFSLAAYNNIKCLVKARLDFRVRLPISRLRISQCLQKSDCMVFGSRLIDTHPNSCSALVLGTSCGFCHSPGSSVLLKYRSRSHSSVLHVFILHLQALKEDPGLDFF